MLDYLSYMDKYGLPRSGIIHIGANHAAECRFYDAYGKVPVAFFEPIPSVYEKALANVGKYPLQRVFQACCSDVDGNEVTFNISSNRGMSSSMYPLGRCAVLHPSISYVDQFTIKTSRAETLLRQHYPADAFNLAVIDTQGADLVALKGLGGYLDYLDGVFIEISDQPLYEGGAAFDDIYQYLNARGFSLSMLYTSLIDTGNAFFKRRESSSVKAVKNAISVRKPAQMSSMHKEFRAELGNDGDIAFPRKFFCTKREREPWWKVDLGATVPIKKIFLFDWVAQIKRSESLIVDVSNDDKNYEVVYDRLEQPVLVDRTGKPLNAAGLTTIDAGVSGRWVRLRLQDTNHLHMRQVSVVADRAA
jgi:FkbM family methyltransferase